MLNREKYATEILDIACSGDGLGLRDGKLVACSSIDCSKCEFNSASHSCSKRTREWANSECVEPSVDWSKVPVDTPILVKDSGDTCFIRRYFAKFENGVVYAWSDGRTSWSDGTRMTNWECAKLAESEG